MPLTRRFMFHASAVALGGHLYSPNDIVIEVDGASALPSIGGRSRSTIKGREYGGLVKFSSASTDAEGRFDDPAKAIAAIAGRLGDDGLATTTSVAAELNDLSIGQGPTLTVKRVAAKFVARNSGKSDEPSIKLTKDTIIEGAAIDGHEFTAEIDVAAFDAYDTLARLKSAPAKSQPPFVEKGGALYSTVVKAIKWTGAPHPKATISGNRISVPGLGLVVMGGILIDRASRRLTMIRVDMGSSDAGPNPPGSSNGPGGVVIIDLEPNGMPYPPYFA